MEFRCQHGYEHSRPLDLATKFTLPKSEMDNMMRRADGLISHLKVHDPELAADMEYVKEEMLETFPTCGC